MNFIPMTTHSTRRLMFLLLAVLAPASALASPVLPGDSQLQFVSPEAAIQALKAASEVPDQKALRAIFGPQFAELQTGDRVLDDLHARQLAAALAQGCVPVPAGYDRLTLDVGTNGWPFAIPLVKVHGHWYFDTAAGREEIITRHIGKDELHAIGVCRAYVVAQQQYAIADPQRAGTMRYARQFRSSPGQRDGLYWGVAANEPASPFGPLVAEAHAEGYVPSGRPAPRPFHGYYFKILTRQGKAAPGGARDYLVHGQLTGGFALIAYPERWDRSGIMTFMINQEGRLFERNLGSRTARLAGAIKAYDPDPEWTLVTAAGVEAAASEK